jgi:hypothetical protein
VPLSKTQVDKLGDRLRRCEVPSDDDLRMLSGFREERRDAMDSVGAGLAEIVGTAPARRLKTINSIVAKLRRESARLSQVQDIAGLRVVRDMTRAEQDALVTQIVAGYPDAKVFDRRANPSHGYRAVHIVASVERHLVEIQVRTDLQHRWAALVERLAAAWGQQIKYGDPPDDSDRLTDGGTSRAAVVTLVHQLGDLVGRHEHAVARATPLPGHVEDRLMDDLATERAAVLRLLTAFSAGPL